DAALPALRLLRRAAERLAVELEALGDEGLGQPRRRALDRVIREPVLPGVERLAADERRQAGGGLRVPDEEASLFLQGGGFEEGRPVEAGRARRKLFALPGDHPV